MQRLWQGPSMPPNTLDHMCAISKLISKSTARTCRMCQSSYYVDFPKSSAPHYLWVAGLRSFADKPLVRPSSTSSLFHPCDAFILFLGCAHGHGPSFLPSSILIHALSSCTAVALHYILVKSEREFIPSAVSPQGRSSLRQLVLDLPPTMVPTVQKILSDPAIVSMDTLQHLRVSRSSPPTNFSLHGLESVALRCSPSLQHLDIDLKGMCILGRFLSPPSDPDPSHIWLDDNSIDLPAIPYLRLLTLRNSVHRARVPNIVMDAIANLPTYMPRLEVVTVVIHANDCRETNFIAAPKADAALLALAQLRDAHFILAADSSAGAHFAVCVEMQLQSASKAGLLSFSRLSSRAKHHYLSYFDD
jgi:hypothetical protein